MRHGERNGKHGFMAERTNEGEKKRNNRVIYARRARTP